ncbi:hypothetical protein KQX54_009688 [Cotesia glomerata]|uniref:Peptidase M12A domain-containing protein n=1 Tax=Cotesia glomerata TaxID=32391 RepID=A0AAV7IXV7_COTGL|nr:hypothetical protein KQX54_009688 [Cotesia glomerata]
MNWGTFWAFTMSTNIQTATSGFKSTRGILIKVMNQNYGGSRAHVDTLGLPYDYQSVMHYPGDAYAYYNFWTTIVPKHPGRKI